MVGNTVLWCIVISFGDNTSITPRSFCWGWENRKREAFSATLGDMDACLVRRMALRDNGR
jgi:hypothetical protein